MVTFSVNGQNEKIKIWPDLAPGTEQNKNEEYFEDGRYKKVYQPDLTIYLPEKPNETRAAVLIFPAGVTGISLTKRKELELLKSSVKTVLLHLFLNTG
jgi:hypothetical protein